MCRYLYAQCLHSFAPAVARYPGARPTLLLVVDIYTHSIYTALGVDIYTHSVYTALGVDISSDPHPGPAPPCSCSRECVPAAGCLILVPTLATRSQAPGVSTSHTHTHADKQTRYNYN